MPDSYKFTFIPQKNLLIEKMYGDVDLDALFAITKALHTHPDYSPEMNAIVDLTECNLTIDFNDMYSFFEYLSNSEQRLRGLCAFVTNSESNFGTSRIYSTLGENLQDEIAYFDDVKSALKWIEDKTR